MKMLFTPLMAKIVDQKPLSPEEIALLREFDPDALQQELAEKSGKLQTLENERLSREELLQKELEELRSTHSALQNDFQELQRRQKIEALAGHYGCTDPEYLDFRARRAGIDLNDEAASTSFVEEIARTSPGCFKARIKSGSSELQQDFPETAGNDFAGFAGADRISRITGIISGIPAQ